METNNQNHPKRNSGSQSEPVSDGTRKSNNALREEAILEFWNKERIFEKTLAKDSPKGEFVFYEGPPTANGKPGIHHLEARAFKDVLPRYKTMQGYHVRRKAGWDTHGLPVELGIEKELGLNSKKKIEEYGIAEFNEKCKESVHKYIDLWKNFTERMGYWVDFEDAYYTYNSNFIESIWSIVGKAEERGLLYKDYKVVPWCPRCGTGLSSHELAQGYEDVKDLSVTVKFKIIGLPAQAGFDKAYFLAWTTTPWTLPGNVGLAVGKDIEYVEAKVATKEGSEIFVLAKDRLSVLTEEYEIIATHKGSEMVGMSYVPLYPFIKENYKGEDLEKAYKVYVADFVTTSDGTGIVHTAVMYGQEDFELGTKVGLPKYHLVNEDGTFKSETGFLAGRFVKDEAVAVDIIKDLAGKNLLYKKEKYEHSYPHCWRCHTPLIYFARDSWYIRMSEIRGELSAENEKINWEPSHIKEGRFGEWLRDLKDWAISRERYWGTPLPIWVAEDGEKIVVDSYDVLKKYSKGSGNKYFVMRHGGTEGNLAETVSFKKQADDNLTEDGKKQVEKTAKDLSDKKIDLIISSPFTRTRETSEILRTNLGLTEDQVVFDERIHEVNPGDFDGKNWNDYHEYIYKTGPNWFERPIPNGESLKDVLKRTGEALYDLEKKYQGKNILIVTHGGPAWLMFVNAGYHTPDNKEYKIANTEAFVADFKRFSNAEVRELPFVPLPHDENYEFNPHKPFIDEIVLEKDGKEFRRVKEVMDVWFDSGSMPFAQDHYPFENKDWIEGKGYPADFISEGIDQTRGWFYTLLAIGVLSGQGTPYKNVICLGLLLDAKGKKMSKSVGNVVEPMEQIEKFGADTVRLWMYSVNQPGDNKNYDEKTVLELSRQVFGLLYNVLSFYELYRDKSLENNDNPKSENVLDKWIISRLSELLELTTKNLDSYKLLEPVRATRDFIGDLSTWYLRRSRDRIKDGDKDAKQTLYFVLKTLSKILAPFAPFSTEDIWQKLKTETDEESINLTTWPKMALADKDVLGAMKVTQELANTGNMLRKKNNIPVRQPLATFFVPNDLSTEHKQILKEELNVKEITKQDDEAHFDQNITPELKREGDYRELVRAIQDMRKEQGLTPSEMIKLTVSNNLESSIEGFQDDLKKTVSAKEILFTDLGEEKVKIEK